MDDKVSSASCIFLSFTALFFYLTFVWLTLFICCHESEVWTIISLVSFWYYGLKLQLYHDLVYNFSLHDYTNLLLSLLLLIAQYFVENIFILVSIAVIFTNGLTLSTRKIIFYVQNEKEEKSYSWSFKWISYDRYNCLGENKWVADCFKLALGVILLIAMGLVDHFCFSI